MTDGDLPPEFAKTKFFKKLNRLKERCVLESESDMTATQRWQKQKP
ncbi:MAG: hypothetical protein LBT59_28265 [Clostridiales bacterium]|jgi:hypothetical protein|nr:hypothetical protein [Clostridiales bacterium]